MICPTISLFYVFDHSKGDYNSICSALLDFDFSICYMSANVEEVWSIISNQIMSVMLRFIPRFKLKRKRRPKWISSDLQHQINCLRTLRRRHIMKNPTEATHAKLREAEDNVQSSIINGKAAYETTLVNDFAGKKNASIYKYMRTIVKDQSTPVAMTLDDITATTDFDKAMQFFFSVFTKCDNTLSSDDYDDCTVSSAIPDLDLLDEEVYNILSSLDITNSTGPDGIGPKILKYCALALYLPLHHLFCLCLSEGTLLLEWCLHRITPIMKSGDKTSIKKL